MKRGWFLLLVMLFPFLPLLSQQLAVVPRAGEGRHARSSEAALWVNPVFVQPSVFFSDREVDIRWRRAWWRAETEPVRPVDRRSLQADAGYSGIAPAAAADSLRRPPFLFNQVQPVRPGNDLPASLLDGLIPRSPQKAPLKGAGLLK